MSETSFNEISALYVQILDNSQNLYEASSEELKILAVKNGAALRSDPHNQRAKTEVLCVLRECIRRKFKIFPYNTQILTVLGSIAGKDKALRGRIAQVRTGEGKSTIVAILAAYMALQGRFVDIITSSRYLAKRDQEKYSDFFGMLGITSSHICEDRQTK